MSRVPPTPTPGGRAAKALPAGVQLRLYVARATPNSVRAEQNLVSTLQLLDDQPGGRGGLGLDIIDVFASPKRAVADGVFVTPTLIVVGSNPRLVMIGDLTDTTKLRRTLETLRDGPAADK